MEGIKKVIDNKVRVMDWSGLQVLWEKIKDDENFEHKGYYFENFIIRAFELSGATVTYPYRVSFPKSLNQIEQIDGALYVSHIACLVESKCYSDINLNILPIAKLKNQLQRRPSSLIGSVFSYTDFTDAAIELTRYTSHNFVLLWEKQQIDFCIQRTLSDKAFIKVFHAKYRHAIEQNIHPNYNPTTPKVWKTIS